MPSSLRKNVMIDVPVTRRAPVSRQTAPSGRIVPITTSTFDEGFPRTGPISRGTVNPVRPTKLPSGGTVLTRTETNSGPGIQTFSGEGVFGIPFLPDWGDIFETVGGWIGLGGNDPRGGFRDTCPDGYKRDDTGNCVQSGVRGTVERFLPGGQTGTLADEYGEAVMGSFGIPALVPRQTGTVVRSDGTVAPTLGCPPGAVLGRDNLCYQKGSIPRQFRKWKPAPKPPMSGADAKALRRIGTLTNRVKRLAKSANLTCKRR